MNNSKWFVFPRPNSQSRLRLFCFPYAGSGAFAFRGWPNYAPETVEICAVQLPGRETRMKEPLFNKLPPLVDALMEALPPYTDKPFAFFGHSLGAIVAFELSRALRQEKEAMPLHLFVSARPAPHMPNREVPFYCLPDAELFDSLRRFNGTAEAVLGNAELMEVLVPVLRADFEINETYIYTPDDPLDCPIFAFRGSKDDIANYDEVVAWREQTTSAFALRTLPGGHFFINDTQDHFWQILAYDLRQIASKLR